jgi:hypothetical protein
MEGQAMSGYNVGESQCVRESDKAIQVFIGDIGESVWIPKSQVHDDSEVWKLDQEGDLVVSDWFARKQGWT